MQSIFQRRKGCPMNISDTLNAQRVLTGLKASTPRAALTAICETMLPGETALCAKAIVALLAREDVGSTGVGNGIAIPHAKLSGIDQPFVGFATLQSPIHFGTSDEAAIDLIFVVLMPHSSEQESLFLLSRIVKVLRMPGVADAVRHETNPMEVARQLTDAEWRFLQVRYGKA